MTERVRAGRAVRGTVEQEEPAAIGFLSVSLLRALRVFVIKFRFVAVPVAPLT